MPIKIFTEKGIPKAEPDSSAMGDKQFKNKIPQISKNN